MGIMGRTKDSRRGWMIPKIKQLLKHPKNKVYVAVGIAVMVAITSLFGYTAYAYDKKTIKLVKKRYRKICGYNE